MWGLLCLYCGVPLSIIALIEVPKQTKEGMVFVALYKTFRFFKYAVIVIALQLGLLMIFVHTLLSPIGILTSIGSFFTLLYLGKKVAPHLYASTFLN